MRQFGGRGEFFAFDYEVAPDPTTEGVAMRLGPDLRKGFPQEFWPGIETGTRNGWEASLLRGTRLCCIRFTVVFAKYHDVDTSPAVVQRCVAKCLGAEVAEQRAEPIPSLRTEWLTSDVVALAHGIHANAALDGLPALTDALIEAGCDDWLVMEHLKTCPDHAPSCWVVEMILDQLKE
jgi:hypothetical protein